jgi:hypothetical protein
MATTKKGRDKPRRQTDLEKIAAQELRIEAIRAKAAAARAAQKAAEKKRRGVSIRKTSAFAQAQYSERLKTVAKYLDGYDKPELKPARMAKIPAGAEAKRERSNARARVNRAFRKLRPYIARPQKTVKARGKRADALREYSGLPKLKGIRAVPVPTIEPTKARVSVDRKGRVRVQVGSHIEREYLFNKKPRSPDDVEAYAQELIKKLPPGNYAILTSVRELLPTIASKAVLMNEVRRFLIQYNSRDGLIKSIRGFKFLGGNFQTTRKRIKQIKESREQARELRANVWKDVAEAAKQSRKKARQKISKRARLTGRG